MFSNPNIMSLMIKNVIFGCPVSQIQCSVNSENRKCIYKTNNFTIKIFLERKVFSAKYKLNDWMKVIDNRLNNGCDKA